LLLARWLAEAQIRAIVDAASLVLSNDAAVPAPPIIACGIGLVAVEEVARRLGCAYARLDQLLDVVPDMRTAVCHCAPAAALAALAS
jgi:(4-(4-[2-(gamma-L-glutamylamino)ethyl]phenoxymethyl)furan-2-yl)methanamine synthase